MRIGNFVTSAAFMAALLTSSALVSKADAAGGGLRTPSTAWAVTQIADVAGPYCALARKFSGDMVMTFAQNQSEQVSFALDFQKPVLGQGGKVDVVLDPGAGQQRAYSVVPVSGQALVVRLGRDEAFLSALDKTGFLRVEAGEQSYQFNVEDMKGGRERLQGCVTAMVAPAAGEQDVGKVEAEVLTPGPLDGVDRLKSEIARLSDENRVLEGKLSAGGASRGAEAVTAGLSARINELESENTRLKADLQGFKPKEERLAALERQVSELKERNKSLQGELNSAQTASVGGVDEASVERQIEAARESVEQEYKAKLSALSEENAALKAADPVEVSSADPALLEQLRQQIGQIENENRLLKESAAKAQSDIIAQKEQEIQAAREEGAEQVAVLQKSLEELKGEKEKAEAKILEVGEKSSELQSLREENASLKALAEKGDGKIAALEAENARLKKEIELASASPDAPDLAGLEKDNAALKVALEDAEEKVAELQKALAEPSTVTDESQKLVELEGQLKEMAVENRELKNKLSSAKKVEVASASVVVKKKPVRQARAEMYGQAEWSWPEIAVPVRHAQDRGVMQPVSMASASGDLAEGVETHQAALTPVALVPPSSATEATVASVVADTEVPDEAVAQIEPAAGEEASVPGQVIAQGDADLPAEQAAAAEAQAASYQNEAQRQEQAVRQNLQTPAAVPVVAPQTAVQQPVAAVPAAPAAAAQDVYSRVPGRELSIAEVQAAQRRAREKQLQELSAATQQGGVSSVTAGASAPAAATVPDVSASPLPAVAPAPVPVAAPVQPVAPQPVSAPAQISAPAPAPQTSAVDSVVDMLQRARVVDPQYVQSVGDGAYQWQVGAVFGTAEQKAIAAGQTFDALVKEYLDRTQQRCPGDFAASPDESITLAGGRADSYEIACVGAQANSSASLLFIEKDGVFTVVAHEAPAVELGQAMDYRNQIKQVL